MFLYFSWVRIAFQGGYFLNGYTFRDLLGELCQKRPLIYYSVLLHRSYIVLICSEEIGHFSCL